MGGRLHLPAVFILGAAVVLAVAVPVALALWCDSCENCR
jgi:hypothetical protein